MSKYETLFWKHLHGDFARSGFAVNEAAPGFVSLVDDLHRVLLVFGLAGEGELVLRFAIGDLVDPSHASG